MHKLPPLLLAASLLCLAPAQAAEPQMPVTEIQRGMEGTCRTVFQGKTVEPFGFRVLSLMQGMLGPKQDVILARLTGEKAEFTGVVAGMSGSPCYINGRLIGALAYRFGNFSKEPIAGITPIANMLDIFRLPPEPRRVVSGLYQPQPLRSALQRQSPAMPAGLQPIATPLSFGGFRPEVLRHYLPELEKMGFQAVSGGISTPSSIAHPDMPQSLEAGGAIAGQLVRGDLSIDGTGTVSYIEGSRVLAFGHPFFNAGYVQIPMATAWIHHILASEAGSFKMSQSGNTVGTITQDRLTAIYGEIGKMAPMIPVQIQVEDGVSVDPQQIRLEVFQNPAMTPLILVMSIHNVLTSRLNFNLGGTLTLDGRLEVDGRTLRFTRHHAVTETEEVILQAVQELGNQLYALWNNPFQPPQISQLALKIALRPDSRQTRIRRMWSDRDLAAPGDSLVLSVELETWRQEREIRRFRYQIPTDTPEGPLTLLALDAQNMERLEQSVRMGYRDYDDLLEHLFQRRQNTDLHLLQISEENGLSQNSALLPRLPASVQELLHTPETIGLTVPIRSPVAEQRIPLNTELNGGAMLSLLVTSHARAIN